MADILSTGSSALLAYQTALNTTSHNIANANTTGYSRQRVDLSAKLAQGSGSGYVGTGVDVASVQRITDALVNARLQTSNSAYSRIDTYSNYAAQIDTLMSDSGTSLSAPLQSFFDAASALANSPTSTAARQSLLGSAQTLGSRVTTMQSQLDGMNSDINQSLAATVSTINDDTQALARLNEQIVNAQSMYGGQPPNDLLDQRDQLVQKIAGNIGISTAQQDDGSLNVFTASGQALVVGKQATALGTAPDAYASGALDVTYKGAAITSQLSGGTVGGLLDARREVIDPARNELGKLAAGIASAVNTQNAAGVDLAGNRGGDLLVMPAGTAYAASANNGNAAMSVAITDVGALDGSNYVLKFDGTAWSATDAGSGATVALSGSGVAGDPLKLGGVAITLGGSAQAGDKFLVQPTAGAASQLKLATSDASRVAAASAVSASAASGNSSAVAAIKVSDGSNAALTDPVTITFTGANTYQINGSGSYAYNSGDAISVNGWSLSLGGTAAAGDSFTIRKTGANSSDNSNAQSLAQLGGKGLFDGGLESISAAQSSLTTQAATRAQQASLALDAQTTVKTQAESARDSVSGVNLDEEAADLLRFQQAYQAAAQVIATANQIFQSLLQATRG
ncbi:flagellar hook-associated protein FlgK [Solimonas terrae]|uniref:Flagellar hook-associated protein 1 n=1 Tax=Solimonas terrae TaxID=1396819 RepID=A0A6M2BP68_9GAMM|nr:flagellar hook-associated protein FlgK [Solimonas terrae]NGY04412.1 flagellar hook-associated protein FlgK [Solimonas terrae]